METTLSENSKNVSSMIHLSTFTKYFFPFGNFIAPLLLWNFNKDKKFVDNHGIEALNFQLSMLIYSIIIVIICIPFIIYYAADFYNIINSIESHIDYNTIEAVKKGSNMLFVFPIAAIFLFGLFVIELYAVISAAINASRGKTYQYPLSISFIKKSITPQNTETNQSKNEQSS